MKKMDSLGLKLCSYQAKLFEYSLQEAKCSSKIFIRRFMNSSLAKRMDNGSILFDSLDISDAMKEIEEQYGESTYGKDKFSIEELHWIGYLYRYWAYVEEKTSKQVYKIIKPDQLQKLYFPYHSLDPQQAIDRILEELEIEDVDQNDDIAKGVIILRKVRNKDINTKNRK